MSIIYSTISTQHFQDKAMGQKLHETGSYLVKLVDLHLSDNQVHVFPSQ